MIEDSAAVELSEYTATLDQVLEMAHRSELADKVHRISTGFPTGTHLKKLDFKLESPPTLKVACIVQADTANKLQITLSRVIAHLGKQYRTAQPLTLNDIDIQLKKSHGGQEPRSYLIEFKLELL